MHTHHFKTWREAAGLPEISAWLDRLPEGLSFPDDFPEPIHYDAQNKHLIYRGFMAAASYQFLHQLSSDFAYLSALDALYETSVFTSELPAMGSYVWGFMAAATVLVVAVLVALRLLH